MATLATLPLNRRDRWTWLARFLDEWYPPNKTALKGFAEDQLDEAERRIGYQLPNALREFYCLFSNCSGQWCVQDRMSSPDGLQIEGDLLVFLVESQGVVQWGVPLAAIDSEDPPVFLDMCDLGEERHAESKSFSEFAVALALYNFKFVSEHVAAGSARFPSGGFATELLGKPTVAPWHWPKYPTTLSLWHESVLEVQGLPNETCWVTLASKSKKSFDADLKRLESLGIGLSVVD
jgi:hypothetical protein